MKKGVCPKCGLQNPEGRNNCFFCGASLVELSKKPEESISDLLKSLNSSKGAKQEPESDFQKILNGSKGKKPEASNLDWLNSVDLSKGAKQEPESDFQKLLDSSKSKKPEASNLDWLNSVDLSKGAKQEPESDFQKLLDPSKSKKPETLNLDWLNSVDLSKGAKQEPESDFQKLLDASKSKKPETLNLDWLKSSEPDRLKSPLPSKNTMPERHKDMTPSKKHEIAKMPKSGPSIKQKKKKPILTITKRFLSVFLCHSSGDKPTVRKLYRQLRKEKWIDPWLDEEKLLPGEKWDLEIRKAVKAADVVIVCLSSGSVNKEGYIQKEIKYALDIADEKPEGTIFVIPLKLEQCDVPDRLGTWQWVNYYEEGAYHRLMKSLHKRAGTLGIDNE